MSKEKEDKNEVDVSEIEVRQENVHNLVSRWMDDTLGLDDSENDGDESGDEDEKNIGAEEQDEAEVRLPRVGLGAEVKAQKGAWKKNEAATEKLEPGARGVAERLVRQGKLAKAGADGSKRAGVRRTGRDGDEDDDDDGDSKFGNIMKLTSKKKNKGKEGAKDAVTMIMEQKQKKRERKAAAKAEKAAKASSSATEEDKKTKSLENEKKKTKIDESPDEQEEEEKEEEKTAETVEPPTKKPKTGEAFADGDDFISLPEADVLHQPWKRNRKDYCRGEERPKKERYVRPENVPQRSAKVRFEKGTDGQMRKRTKTRSKQKNLRRDHRPLEKKPNTIPLPPQNTHKTFSDDDDD